MEGECRALYGRNMELSAQSAAHGQSGERGDSCDEGMRSMVEAEAFGLIVRWKIGSIIGSAAVVKSRQHCADNKAKNSFPRVLSGATTFQVKCILSN